MTALAVAMVGCASEPPQRPAEASARPHPAPAARPAPASEPDDDIRISGSGVLGTLGDEQVQAAIEQRWPEFRRCKDGAQPKPPWYVGGQVQLKMRVARSGDVKHVSIDDSTLGNWTIERCILAVARTLRFSHPKGGEAEVTFPIQFAARAPVLDWAPEQIAPDVAKHRKDVYQCDKVGVRYPFKLVLYLGAGGKVTSAGIAFPGEVDEAFVDCVVAKAQTWKLTDPLGQVVRTSCEFP